MARAFGLMLAGGWRPARSIVFGSWDAKEFGLVSRGGGARARRVWYSIRREGRMGRTVGMREGWRPERSIVFASLAAEKFGLVSMGGGMDGRRDGRRDGWRDGRRDGDGETMLKEGGTDGTSCVVEREVEACPLRRVCLVGCRGVWTGEHGWRDGAEEPDEWVEDNAPLLSSRAVAYINVDTAVSGAGFHAAATPQLDDVIREVAEQVEDPDKQGQSMYASWAERTNRTVPHLGRLGGGGSDYAPFLQHLGIAAADLHFGEDYPILYDNYHYMTTVLDPLFSRHTATTQLWGSLALHLAGNAALPFNYSTYALRLKLWGALTMRLSGDATLSFNYSTYALKLKVGGWVSETILDSSVSHHHAIVPPASPRGPFPCMAPVRRMRLSPSTTPHTP
ncbi:unnamed protein product [Closterium sp. Naga37s-1]|nr:unnamed protein product [Closterium sp. Naga37s-1]